MIFNPLTKALSTNSRKTIKNVNCPYNIKAQYLKSAGSTNYLCAVCQNPIHDIKDMSEKEVIELISSNPNACIKFDLNYSNIRIVNHNV